MLGNVCEWCDDNRHLIAMAPDSCAAWRGDASTRILRGGAWNYSPNGLRSADRNWFPPDGCTSFMDFRVARQPDPRPPEAKCRIQPGRQEAAFN
jgi:formylglycine-generating enzyme required for sulfatase activity